MERPAYFLDPLFRELSLIIQEENRLRLLKGEIQLDTSEIILLGQMSLLAHQDISSILTLTQTLDLDAKLQMDHFIKQEFKKLLSKAGLIYDEDSHLVWIPPGAEFDELFSYPKLVVKAIDPESALLSKAIKAREKNKILIREAIASGRFPELSERIVECGGDLEYFAHD